MGTPRWGAPLVPGVGTRIRVPLATQVARSQGRRWRGTPSEPPHMGSPSRPGARPVGVGCALGAGAAQPRPPRPGAVAEPGDAFMVEALVPAPHGGGVVAEGLGDGGGRVAFGGGDHGGGPGAGGDRRWRAVRRRALGANWWRPRGWVVESCHEAASFSSLHLTPAGGLAHHAQDLWHPA